VGGIFLKRAGARPNVIKLRKEPSSEMDLAFFLQKVEEFLKKGLTKRQKCAGDFNFFFFAILF
jgi:hypothetical protein